MGYFKGAVSAAGVHRVVVPLNLIWPFLKTTFTEDTCYLGLGQSFVANCQLVPASLCMRPFTATAVLVDGFTYSISNAVLIKSYT